MSVVASGGYDRVIKIWDTETYNCKMNSMTSKMRPYVSVLVVWDSIFRTLMIHLDPLLILYKWTHKFSLSHKQKKRFKIFYISKTLYCIKTCFVDYSTLSIDSHL